MPYLLHDFQDIWKKNEQIHIHYPDDGFLQLAVTSTAEEWSKAARILFDKRHYLQAVDSYRRAGLVRESDVAYAYDLRQRAKGQPITDRASRLNAYIAAAQAFLSSAEAAGNSQDRLTYYRIAAECFAEGKDYGRAGKAFLSAFDFTRSAVYYRKAGMFDEAVEVVQNHKEGIPAETAEKIVKVARLHYLTVDKIESVTTLLSVAYVY